MEGDDDVVEVQQIAHDVGTLAQCEVYVEPVVCRVFCVIACMHTLIIGYGRLWEFDRQTGASDLAQWVVGDSLGNARTEDNILRFVFQLDDDDRYYRVVHFETVASYRLCVALIASYRDTMMNHDYCVLCVCFLFLNVIILWPEDVQPYNIAS